ncbi:unnamed protein product, partial [Polarella glacialis]
LQISGSRQLSNVEFLLADASTASFEEDARPDIVVALHACGALSDVALSLAAKNGSAFCICTCCFRANRNLQVGGGSAAAWLGVPATTLDALAFASELQDDANTSRSAMHTLSALRAEAVLRHWLLSAAQVERRKSLEVVDVQVECFSEAFSGCNFCITGTL